MSLRISPAFWQWLSKKLIGSPADTTVLAHYMSTSSLFLTFWSGRVIPLLDERGLFPNFSTSMASSDCPLSNDLWVISRACIVSCSSLLFTSLTTWAWHSMCSADGLHYCTLPQNRQVLESPSSCWLSPVSVLFRIWLVSISATGVQQGLLSSLIGWW